MRHPAHAVAAAFLLAAALMTAADLAPALAGGGSNTKTDPCALVTADEVAAALQDRVGPGENDGIGDCNFRGASGYDSAAAIAVDENPGRRDFFESQAARGNVTRLDGIAEGAFAFDSPAGFTQVTLLKGETLATVTLSSPRLANRLEAAAALARAAAARLGTEAALAKEPGLEALVGEWFADAGDPARGTREVRRWVIEPDGRWTMTAAPEYGGMLVAENGRWLMDSPQESFSGSYDIGGADGFSTSGNVSADWSRVPDSRLPDGVDSAFLGIWSQIPLGGMARGPLDPALTGLWQARLDGDRPSILVWRISEDGYAVLTEITTFEGRLTASAGKLEIEPAGSDAFEATYKVQSRDSFTTSDNAGSLQWQRRGTGLAPR